MNEHGWVIEKDLPVPSAKYGRSVIYPWPQMEDGDSFLLPWVEGITRIQAQNKANSAATGWLYRNRPDLRVVTRCQDDGLRVWFVRRETNGVAD